MTNWPAEKARELARKWAYRVADEVECQREIEAALIEAENRGLEMAAKIVGNHPFEDDAEEGCMDAQGCCEVMQADILKLKRNPVEG